MTNADGQVMGADAPIDDCDVRNLSAVRELYDQIDPIPDGLTERVRFAMALEHMDAEVARLVENSALASVRSTLQTAEQARTIIFESSALTVMVSVSQVNDDVVRVDGWLSPEGEYRVELRTPDAQHRTVADPMGRFVVHELPRGIFRMVIRAPEGKTGKGETPVVITPSVVLD
ncbi:MAG TPA: hypothetical protein VE172_18105 [Stackebrandtia sp.]|jgi:hypothetical protein|uniref:hypothetical protein n=1 Tax=Stackebrandtia sp. TaxID=2023065 RepID=UPI002D269CB5|nr:hypothetical protein [Stackebrandtia sp.]HZE40720.1 hypothetical protein [Stackebrandtia sp.]